MPVRKTNTSQAMRYKQLSQNRRSQQLRDVRFEILNRDRCLSIDLPRLDLIQVQENLRNRRVLNISLTRLHTDLENNTMIPFRRQLTVNLNNSIDLSPQLRNGRLSQELMPPPLVPVERPPQPRRRHAVVPLRRTYKKAFSIDVVELETQASTPYSIGPMIDICQHCGAHYMTREKQNRANVRMSCCKNGSYSLTPYKRCPPALKNLYIGDSETATQFRREIRSINSVFAMASFNVKNPEDRRGQGQGHWCFSVCGQIYHMYNGIPDANQLRRPKLNHYYFLDSEDALMRRNMVFGMRISNEITRTVENTLREHNVYIMAYKTIGEVLRERNQQDGDNYNERNIIVGFMKQPNIMNEQRRNFGLPESRSEIAAVFQGDEPPFPLDLVLYPYNPNASQPHRRHHRLKNLNPLADPMVYPLLFPCGDNGYSMDLYYNDHRRVGRNNERKKITFNEYYRYRLHIRQGFSTLHSGGKLFQQFIVDSWVKIETNRLWWIRKNQENFRIANAEALRRLQNANDNRQRLSQIGQSVIILPSTFHGSERNRQRQYLDAMSVMSRFGKPDLFITMTCNPRWKEIIDNLGPHQKWENRPDLVCRVFHAKLLELMDDLVQKQIFGVVLSYHYVIEFQKRGLPHAHIILTMHRNDKILSVEMVDQIIHSYIPEPNTQSNLYLLVKDFHVHTPCGYLYPNAICMQNNKCKKFYPKAFREHTTLHVGSNRRPEYKRPLDGRTIRLEKYPDRYITNKDIVPYNPFLLAKYHSHINVEVVGSLYTLKYLYKYINKGNDAVTLRMGGDNNSNNNEVAVSQQRSQHGAIATTNDERQQTIGVVDEIQQYQDFRYVSSMEATWRIFEYKMHDRSHSVIVLPIHLENQRNVIYEELDDDDQLQQRLDSKSKLEAFFTLNEIDIEARQYFYYEIPEHYSWNNSNYTWKKRKQISKQIGCIVNITPVTGDQMELFYLRIILSRTKGPTNFLDLKTLENGIICDTYKEVCLIKNFIQGTNEFDKAMGEAAVTCHPRKMRRLFALYCCITFDEDMIQIEPLYRKFRKYLIEDYIVLERLNEAQAERKALLYIEQIIKRNRAHTTLVTFGINVLEEQTNNDNAVNSQNDGEEEQEQENRIRRNSYLENSYNDDLSLFERRRNDQQQQQQQQRNDDNDEEIYSPINLNPDQKRIFLRIMKTITKKNNLDIPLNVLANISDTVTIDDIQEELPPNENVFYIDGAGGTGKTHLYNTLINCIKKYFNKTCISVAWTGIAANLLINGTTVHRAFKLPITLSETTRAGWAVDAQESLNIANNVILIIWDEAPMSPKLAVEAVDRYLRDITKINQVMGGKCCIFGGDFRQIMPVVIGGSRHDVINASLKRSDVLWNHIVQLQLNYNMRALQYPDLEDGLGNKTYSRWLLDLGNGLIEYITLGPNVIIGGSSAPNDLIQVPRMFQLESLDQLIDFVYENDYVNSNSNDNNNIGRRAILCPTNAAVAVVNGFILNKIVEREERIYYSIDEYCSSPDDDFHVPMDLLNSIEAASLPPHKLTLKVGVIVMILKNIDIQDGICNGIRARVINLGDNLIECEILTGCNVGRRIYIPKIHSIGKDTMLPNSMKRFQFPIKLAYAMTINKSQGQSLDKVGIYLQNPCFTHGQLYVAFSRVGSAKNVKIVIEDSTQQGTFKFRGTKRLTRNIVYYEILGNNQQQRLLNDNHNNIVSTRRILNEVDSEHIITEETMLVRNVSDLEEIEKTLFIRDDDESSSGQDSNYDIINDLENFEIDDIIGNIDLTKYNLTLEKDVNDPLFKYDQHFENAVPFRPIEERINRISRYDQAGTSRLIVDNTDKNNKPPYLFDSDSD